MNFANVQEVLTPDQVARYLQVNKDTVYELIRAHRLAATRIGRSYRIPRVDLDVFISANSTRPAVRDAAFRRLQAIGDRHPDLTEAQVRSQLEKLDRVRPSSITYPRP